MFSRIYNSYLQRRPGSLMNFTDGEWDYLVSYRLSGLNLAQSSLICNDLLRHSCRFKPW